MSDLEWDDVSEVTHLAVEQESNAARLTPLERLRLDMEKMVDDNQKMMDEKLAGIQLFLKRHGLIEGEGNEMAIELERTGPRSNPSYSPTHFRLNLSQTPTQTDHLATDTLHRRKIRVRVDSLTDTAAMPE